VEYTSIDEALKIFIGVAAATLLSYGASMLLPGMRLPNSVAVIAAQMAVLISCGLRVVYRIMPAAHQVFCTER
jgi:FlaA1/EpsC-like NDP-sugar epimerase